MAAKGGDVQAARLILERILSPIKAIKQAVELQLLDDGTLAEPPNGWIKNDLGFRQFSMRGLEKVKAEFKLVCLALNFLRRVGAMQSR